MNILKALREQHGLTQESIAGAMSVSTNTIQNWERTNIIPKEQLHKLLDIYKVDKEMRKEVVLSIYGDDREEQPEEKDNFPYFLFEDHPDFIAEAKAARLTEEEMDIFGYLENRRYDEYSFYGSHGGFFRVTNIIQRIRAMGSNEFLKMIYDYGIRTSGQAFSFCALAPKDILHYIDGLSGYWKIENVSHSYCHKENLKDLYSLCKEVAEPVPINHDPKNSEIKTILSLLEKSYDYSYGHYRCPIGETAKKCFAIRHEEIQDEKYMARKKQYLSDLEAYTAHPNLYDREPHFQYSYNRWLELTDIGKKVIEWYEGSN